MNDGEHFNLAARRPRPHPDACDRTVTARRAVIREQNPHRAR
jgi:hypothetical protein